MPSSSNPMKKSKTQTGIAITPKPLLDGNERLWLINLQAELRKHKEVPSVSDFQLASHAAVAKDQPRKAKYRIQGLQKFRQEYNVPEHPTVYEAIKSLHEFVHARPLFVQAFGQDLQGRWVLSYQLKGLTDPSCHRHEMTTEQEFTALFFLFWAMQPDLEAVRKGSIWIGDMEGITRQNLPTPIVNGFRALCRDSFPTTVKYVTCWNVPPIFSMVYTYCRPYFSAHLAKNLVWGCPKEKLQELFPCHVLARSLGGTQSQNDILDALEANLTKRFENEKSFRLNII